MQQRPSNPTMLMTPIQPPTPNSHLKTVAYVGTLSYMSPERLEGEEYSFPSDIWSIGMILYEMVAGHRPFPITDKPILLCEHMRQNDAPNLDDVAQISPQLKDFVKKCL